MTTMPCTWIDRDDVFEGYVRDALAPEERDAFETHFFECAACADKVRTCEALYAELQAKHTPVPATSQAKARPWRWALVPVAVGVVLIAVVAVWLNQPPAAQPESVAAVPAPQPQAPSAAQVPAAPNPAAPPEEPPRKTTSAPVVPLSVLARVEPPVYVPVALRGPRDEAAEKFDAAMRRYAEGDYAGTLPDLRAAAELNPRAVRVAFFLAVCELLTDQTEAAAAGLQRVIALGESPYLEEAHFYLAKARLRQGNLQAARQELRRTAQRRGRLEIEARRLLTQVDALPERKDRPPGK